MNINVRFFGPARDFAGCELVDLTLQQGDTVGDVASLLAQKYPKLGNALGVRLCVNRAYVPLNHNLNDGDEIAVIPPVSGG